MKLLWIVLMFWPGICLAQPTSRPADAKAAEMWQHFFAVRHASFILEGMVVDEQGKPIDDVFMQVQEGRPKKPGSFDTDYTQRRQKINGAFAVKVADADSVDLLFYRDGFFSETVEFGFADGLPKDWQQRIAVGEAVVPDPVKRTSIRVVLERHGKLAELTNVVARITCAASGPGSVWDVSTIRHNGARAIPDPREVASLPDNCIYLDVPTESDGALALDKVRLGKIEQPCPKSLRIVLKGDGGFISAATTEKTEAMQYRRMTEAPDKGYQAELVFNNDAVKRYFHSKDEDAPDVAFFYFKAGKLYGKGRLQIDFPRGGKVTVRLVLRFQPDGTRNVATER